MVGSYIGPVCVSAFLFALGVSHPLPSFVSHPYKGNKGEHFSAKNTPTAPCRLNKERNVRTETNGNNSSRQWLVYYYTPAFDQANQSLLVVSKKKVMFPYSPYAEKLLFHAN